VIVASGYDAAFLDPLGRMLLRGDSYRTLTELVMGAAHELCADRLLVCHEGGYSEAYVPFCGHAVIEQLSGTRTPVEDPYFAAGRVLPYDDLQEHQGRVIDEAARLAEQVPGPLPA
jgi:acetoin utilization deacetylase AcuC-like enzyme